MPGASDDSGLTEVTISTCGPSCFRGQPKSVPGSAREAVSPLAAQGAVRLLMGFKGARLLFGFLNVLIQDRITHVPKVGSVSDFAHTRVR